jgi:DNA-directed RNA polymerase subunit D
MEIEILSYDKANPSVAVFKLKNSNAAFANALRRILLMEIPVLAIDEVIILENTTPLYDEIIAHRLGLLPITTPPGEFNLREECVCEGHGCTQCEVSLNMEKESEVVGEIETVFSGSFVPEDPKVNSVDPGVPILRMTNGQKITIQAIARLGYGKRHAKWQSSIASYKYDPIITINNSKNSNWDEVIKYCPPQILEAKDGKTLTVTNPVDCILCGLCMEKDPTDSINIETNSKDFVFFLNSLGQMPVLDLLSQGLTVLKSKAEELKEKLVSISVPDN